MSMNDRYMTDLYEITEGPDGPYVAGPYRGMAVAAMVRDSLPRPWRMIWRRRHYWVQPTQGSLERRRAS